MKRVECIVPVLISILIAVHVVSAQQTLYEVSLDSDPGWTVTGEWAFGVPGGAGGEFGQPDPTTGATGSNVYGVNLDGDYSTVMTGPAHMIAGPFDLTGYEGIILEYKRWLNIDQQPYVRAAVEVSADGFNWTQIWANGSAPISDGAWYSAQHSVPAIADDKPLVYFRWEHEVTDPGALPYSGWNIDDIRILGVAKDPFGVVPTEGLVSSGPQGGPFVPASKTYMLTNSGDSVLDWTASANQNWVAVAPASGTVPPHGSVSVTVAFSQAAKALAKGSYSATVTFTNTASGARRTRGVSLTVYTAAPADAFLWFPLDSDPGWTRQGQWEFGRPAGGSDYCGDPSTAHTGDNVFGYNLAGDYPNELPATNLTTLRMDCSRYEGIHLTFWRWLSIEYYYWDKAKVQVSRNGSTWTDVWDHNGSTICDGEWLYCDYDISTIADRQRTVFVRWVMGPTDSSVTYGGWNLDDIALTGDYVDDLTATPRSGLTSSGIEGGPFSPNAQTYTLENIGTQTVDWTAEWAMAWLAVEPASGTLSPGGTAVVTVSLKPEVAALTRGTYMDEVAFRNMNNDLRQRRQVTLTVDPYPVVAQIQDSIAPVDDLDMPFGDVFLGLSRQEQITISNTDAQRDLVITKIAFGDLYFEDFSDGAAQDWWEDVDADWNVVNQEYRASKANPTSSVDSMVSTYGGKEWSDCYFEVHMRRTAEGYADYILLRASADIEVGSSLIQGSGYGFGVDTNAFYIFKVVNGTLTTLSSWVTTPYLQPLDQGNKLAVQAVGSTLSFYINGTLVWTGVDDSIAAGRIGLLGFTSSDYPTVYHFDDVFAGPPEESGGAIPAEQVWYNTYPSDSTDPMRKPPGWLPPKYPGVRSGVTEQLMPVAPLGIQQDLRLSLPPNGPPWIVPAGGTLDVGVVFQPLSVREYDSSVVIVCNDATRPEIEIALSGRGLLDYLQVTPDTNLEMSGRPGGPFSPETRDYVLANTGPTAIDWTASKTATWLDISVASGTLAPAESVIVRVSLGSEAFALPEGTYTDTVVFTNTTSTVAQQRAVRLSVRPGPKLWVDPQSLSMTLVEGQSATVSLNLGNTGDADLQYRLEAREVGRSVIPQGLPKQLAATGDTIILEYDFGKPDAEKEGQYTTLRVMGLESYEHPGAPIVPVRPVNVLVPFGKQIADIRAIALGVIEPPDPVVLAPGQKPYPLSRPESIEFTGPDPAFYGLAGPWPPDRVKQVGLQSKHGYQILTLNLFPVQYLPAAKRISYCTRMRLEIDLTVNTKLMAGGRAPSASDLGALLPLALDNPGAIDSYASAPKTTQTAAVGGPLSQLAGGPAKYVIITSTALENSAGPWNLQALVEAKRDWGLTAAIVTTEWIYANYDGTRPSGGSDNQTRIRNFLIDAYQNWGTRYALLAGTAGIVPARMLYVWGDTMPVDNYYGCVDPPECTFDGNANGLYGEETDGVNGADVDLRAEVHIGRAAVANATEVANFVKKTLAYDATLSTDLPNVSMVGEYLGFGGASEYATGSMEQIRLGSCADGYCTIGFENHAQPDFYEFDTSRTLYDAPGYSWTESEILSLMNSGVHVINHLGHANETYCMKLNTSDLAGLTNTEGFVAYSQGCYPGAFDYSDCYAEVLTTMSHGAVAAIMNARYGYGRSNSTDGPSQRFARQFWDAALGEGIVEMGPANQDSKEDNLWGIDEDVIRWCYFELNLFGDPQQRLRFVRGCEWLSVDPKDGVIVPGASTTVSVTFKTITDTGKVLQPGTYSGHILVMSNDPDTPILEVPVTLTITPDDLSVVPTDDFSVSGPVGDWFNPECMVYRLSNTGSAPLDWTVQATQNWVFLAPAGGTLQAGQSAELNVCLINGVARGLPAGLHSDTITVTNTGTGNRRTRNVSLTIGPPHSYTELFDAGDNDLDNQMITFTPANTAGFYRVCREEAASFAADPAGGTPLSLGDDDHAEVTLADGAKVRLYGQVYGSFFVGSNGYITFAGGDADHTESLEDHFAQPRISALFDDLSPVAGGTISWKQLTDRAVVTFLNVPEYLGAPDTSSFQVEMFFDGVIRMTWLNVGSADGLAGLSRGQGVAADFVEDDLTGFGSCDCNRNGVPDACDVSCGDAGGLCDVPGCGTAVDCNANDIPDECEPDCNANGVADECDVTSGTSTDCNQNTIPDDCEPDMDGDQVIDVCDNCPSVPNADQVDTDGDGYGDVCDNCPANANVDQCDIDQDGVGDACEVPRVETALFFDGVNDRVIVPHHASLAFGEGDFTIEAWFRTTASGMLMDKRTFQGSGEVGFLLLMQSDGRMTFGVEIAAQNTNGTEINSTQSFRDGQWHHVAGVRAGSEIRLYVDGVQRAQTTLLVPMNISNTHTLVVGNRHDFTIPFKGSVDDVRIWAAARSQEEIVGSMGQQLYGNEPALIGYYQINGGCAQQIVADLSPTGNNATLGSDPTGPDAGDPLWVISDAPLAPVLDTDGDGLLDGYDNCPTTVNPGQEDVDSDGRGDVCDNCLETPNYDQMNSDTDPLGDACDPDDDNDGLADADDNCPRTVNPDQANHDGDPLGDACDRCPDTLEGAVIDPEGCPLPITGDFDNDSDVDQFDFALMQRCVVANGEPQNDPDCQRARLDEDLDADAFDMMIFLRCFSGPGLAGDPNCAED